MHRAVDEIPVPYSFVRSGQGHVETLFAFSIAFLGCYQRGPCLPAEFLAGKQKPANKKSGEGRRTIWQRHRLQQRPPLLQISPEEEAWQDDEGCGQCADGDFHHIVDSVAKTIDDDAGHGGQTDTDTAREDSMAAKIYSVHSG